MDEEKRMSWSLHANVMEGLQERALKGSVFSLILNSIAREGTER